MTAPALTPQEIERLTRDLDYLGLLVSFPWHRQQQFALASATNVVVIQGGNRSGKTQSALGVVSRLIRREGPIYRRLREPERRPLKIWVSPQTLEKYKSLWEPRLLGQVFHGLKFDYVQSPQHVFTWDDGCARGNTVWAKCLPEWEPVRLADGRQVPIGTLRVGDSVLGFDPETRRAIPARVTAVQRTGERAVDRLTFSDGSTLHATPEHRVCIQRAVCGKPRRHEATVVELANLAGRPALMTARERQYSPSATLPIPPYLLGALLGDGHLSVAGVTFTSADVEVASRCERDLAHIGYRWTKLRHRYGYAAVEAVRRPGRRPRGKLLAALGDLGLLGSRCTTKHIPDAYLRASHKDRLKLLAGLIDTDGDYRRFSSRSRQLATDFMELVRSVGGRATRHRRLVRCRNGRDPERRVEAWVVEYNINNVHIPLALERKRKPTAPHGRDTTLRPVVARESVGRHQCVDISIDHPSHLFLAGEADVAVHNSQEQGFMAFESDEVDLVVFDEEPGDKRLYTSAEQRLATTNGIILFAFTPLLGLTWTHSTFYVPAVKEEYKVADRVYRRGNAITVVQMGMADNPAAVAGGGVARLQNNPAITQAEKNTRLYGHYGFAEGLIFPQFADLYVENDASPYLLDELPRNRSYNWLLTVDPNKRHGGLLTAFDHEENRYYVAEHYAEGLPDRKHAEAYFRMLKPFRLVPGRDVGVYADPGGAGAQAIINLGETGLHAQPVPKDAGSVAASIKRLRSAAWIDPNHPHPVTKKRGAPHVFFLRSLRSQWTLDGVDYNESRLMWEFRQYRQKEAPAPPDTPIKEKDDVVDPARYVELVRPYAPEYHDPTKDLERAGLDPLSRKATDEFEELVKKANRPKTTENYW